MQAGEGNVELPAAVRVQGCSGGAATPKTPVQDTRTFYRHAALRGLPQSQDASAYILHACSLHACDGSLRQRGAVLCSAMMCATGARCYQM